MGRSRSLQDRLSFLGYDRQCRKVLKAIQATLAPALDGVLDDFYAFIRVRPETRGLLPGQEARVREAHKAHWLQALSGDELDEAGYARALDVGRAHERIGLGLGTYLGGYCRLLNRFTEVVAQKYADDAAAFEEIQAVQKAVFLDIDFVTESYFEAKNASIRKILRHAEAFIGEIEQIDSELALLGHRLPPQTESLSKSLETCRGQLEQLADCLTQAKAGSACFQQMERLRDALAACEQGAVAMAAQAQIVSQQLDRLNAEVAARKTQHRLNFVTPPPGFLSRLKQAAQVLFPPAPG